MEFQKCYDVPCDGVNCLRARMLKALLEEEPDETVYEIINFTEEKILPNLKCQQPEALQKILNELRDKFIFKP